MKCAIMQPTYFPWMGYFSLIDSVDRFIFLDDVKLEKHSWHIRNRIKTSNGELFLTIPTHAPKGRLETLINETKLDNTVEWREKHIKGIYFSYLKAPYFSEVFPIIENLLRFNTETLSVFNINLISIISKHIGIKTQLLSASDMKNITGKKDMRLVNFCKFLKCNEYISPQGSAVYIEQITPGGEFPKNGITLKYQNYVHPIYTQLWGKFIPFMGILDLLFNCGLKNSLEVIRSGKNPETGYKQFRKIHKY